MCYSLVITAITNHSITLTNPWRPNRFSTFVLAASESHRCPTLSLVPTPSVPDTRIGSMKPAAFRSNRPAKPPSSALQPGGIESNGKIYSRVYGDGRSGMYNLLVRLPRLKTRHFLPSLIRSLFSPSLKINFPASSQCCRLFCVFTRARRGLGQGLDHVHQSVASGDVNSAVFIGETSIRDTV